MNKKRNFSLPLKIAASSVLAAVCAASLYFWISGGFAYEMRRDAARIKAMPGADYGVIYIARGEAGERNLFKRYFSPSRYDALFARNPGAPGETAESRSETKRALLETMMRTERLWVMERGGKKEKYPFAEWPEARLLVRREDAGGGSGPALYEIRKPREKYFRLMAFGLFYEEKIAHPVVLETLLSADMTPELFGALIEDRFSPPPAGSVLDYFIGLCYLHIACRFDVKRVLSDYYFRPDGDQYEAMVFLRELVGAISEPDKQAAEFGAYDREENALMLKAYEFFSEKQSGKVSWWVMEALVQGAPRNPRLRKELALYYYRTGRLEKALEHLKAAASLEPGNKAVGEAIRVVESRIKKK